MRYFCNRDSNGNIVNVRCNVRDETQAGMEEITEKAYDEWMAGFVEPSTDVEEDVPSAAERLRADIDYLAALQGVTL